MRPGPKSIKPRVVQIAHRPFRPVAFVAKLVAKRVFICWGNSYFHRIYTLADKPTSIRVHDPP